MHCIGKQQQKLQLDLVRSAAYFRMDGKICHKKGQNDCFTIMWVLLGWL